MATIVGAADQPSQGTGVIDVEKGAGLGRCRCHASRFGSDRAFRCHCSTGRRVIARKVAALALGRMRSSTASGAAEVVRDMSRGLAKAGSSDGDETLSVGSPSDKHEVGSLFERRKVDHVEAARCSGQGIGAWPCPRRRPLALVIGSMPEIEQ